MNQTKSDNSSPAEESLELESSIPEQEENSATTNEIPNFGWSTYAERMNGRFAMIGFVAILLVELFAKKSSFLEWSGLIK